MNTNIRNRIKFHPPQSTLVNKPVYTFPESNLPEPFHDWIMDNAKRMQCPIDSIAVSVVVAISSIIGPSCGIKPNALEDFIVIPHLSSAMVSTIHLDELTNFSNESVIQIMNRLANINFMAIGATKNSVDKLPYFRFDKEAQKLFYIWMTKFKKNSFTKHQNLMPSLALLFHLINVADGQLNVDVGFNDSLRAICWCDYLENQESHVTPEVRVV